MDIKDFSHTDEFADMVDKRLKETKVSAVASNDGVKLPADIEVVSVEKYRDKCRVNEDYNRARVVINLKFPEHQKLYRKLKRMAT
jgi:hypothetical protein